jgi:peptidyl-prolyl cis-trans isomerase A (cyclophilin A)
MFRTLLTALLCFSCVALADDAKKDAKKEGKKMIAVFNTSMGTFKAELYKDKVPNAVDNFAGLAEGTKEWTDPKSGKKMKHKPLYDGTTFHRIIDGFMIQGGDPLGTGTGGPGFQNTTEKHPDLKHDKEGVLAMANSGPDTDGCQFYVTVAATPWLDEVHPPSKGYTIFGQVVEGMDVVHKIGKVQTSGEPMNKPLKPVTIKSVKIERK